MKKRITKTIYTALCIFCVASCAPSEVDVYFPSDFVKANEVKINGEINLVDHAGESPYSSVKVPRGNFSVDINGATTEVKTMYGGMLNLNEEEFVIYPIFYSNNAKMKDSGSIPIVVDSVAYFNKNSVMMRLPMEQRKNLALKQGAKPYEAKLSKIWQTGVVRKNDFFAEKGWELDINDEIPEQVTVRTQENMKNKASKTKTILVSSAMFKLQALISDNYWTLDLREIDPEVPAAVNEKSGVN